MKRKILCRYASPCILEARREGSLQTLFGGRFAKGCVQLGEMEWGGGSRIGE